ncbi:transposase [Streptacidiphilus anmyonensis]|uniref:transposase n=1 Tax=Streptacidiphilus anmyonensis TaxID=405782 RepID=UPI00191BDB41|nr:transposase [Streptacidiphilus anmyonensis]
MFADEDFTDWFPADGRKGLSPAQLALASMLQFAENLTDRQAAESVRFRIDWKYCLGLELDDPGFDYSVLSEFRDRMADGDRADRFLAVMVARLVGAGVVKQRGRVRTDSTHVLAAVRRLNRAELVAETLRLALDALALHADDWLARLVTQGWDERYGRPVRYDRLPRGKEAVLPQPPAARGRRQQPPPGLVDPDQVSVPVDDQHGVGGIAPCRNGAEAGVGRSGGGTAGSSQERRRAACAPHHLPAGR